MPKDFDTMEDSNPSANPSIHEVSDPSRRVLMKTSVALAIGSWFGMQAGCAAMTAGGGASIGFKPVPMAKIDAIVVPEGYVADVMAPWGEPIGVAGAMPAWKPDASNTAAEQALQMGMHHDGIAFYPLGEGDNASRRGLLTMNHEYVDDGLLHADGLATWSAEKVMKAQAAHGVSVIEVAMADGRWQVVRPSRYAKRHTSATPFVVQGPAAGHALLKTAADPDGRRVLGTLNNCASSPTPWGTYLSGEENWAFYFDGGSPNAPADAKRYGVRDKSPYRWAEHDERFDFGKHPNEFNRFGYVVEIDPMAPDALPVKRTALGRCAHEGAWVAVTKDARAVVYTGEDARFEYIFKFVSRDRIAPARPGVSAAQANRELLDHGTLYVARFDAGGKGQWIPLVAGQGPLTADKGFPDQASICVRSRQAGDAVGATKMDRPEWLAIDERTREVYCTLTNNSARGTQGQPGVDAANPRANNAMGQIIRWKEDGDYDGTTFAWDHLVLAGDPANERADAKGNIVGDIFGCPDGIVFDARGVLWIETDIHATQMGQGEFKNLPVNQMLACNPRTKEIRRFLTAPVNCEVTGIAFTPDMRTMFINIQHPGETPTDRSDPKQPDKFSNWPEGKAGARPRSATVVIRRKDGGIVGT
jgi:secreted PhoX family phosphatase